MIPLSNCKSRHAYRLRSRNLNLGVFNPANSGFIGIREKFGNRYLFTEYHNDTGPPFGTAHPIEAVAELPAEIVPDESLGTVCETCGQPLQFIPDAGKITGKWCRPDGTHCANPAGCGAVSIPNRALFEWLVAKQEAETNPSLLNANESVRGEPR
jgi:hypothetical protein